MSASDLSDSSGSRGCSSKGSSLCCVVDGPEGLSSGILFLKNGFSLGAPMGDGIYTGLLFHSFHSPDLNILSLGVSFYSCFY